MIKKLLSLGPLSALFDVRESLLSFQSEKKLFGFVRKALRSVDMSSRGVQRWVTGYNVHVSWQGRGACAYSFPGILSPVQDELVIVLQEVVSKYRVRFPKENDMTVLVNFQKLKIPQVGLRVHRDPYVDPQNSSRLKPTSQTSILYHMDGGGIEGGCLGIHRDETSPPCVTIQPRSGMMETHYFAFHSVGSVRYSQNVYSQVGRARRPSRLSVIFRTPDPDAAYCTQSEFVKNYGAN